MNPYRAMGPNQTSRDAVYMHWPSHAMLYPQPYDQFRHAVFQVCFCVFLDLLMALYGLRKLFNAKYNVKFYSLLKFLWAGVSRNIYSYKYILHEILSKSSVLGV